jgi:protein-S-isoprenylcysteine O-methyltransferase Ste14
MHSRYGEHPFGDRGQLVFLALFLLVWVGDSFFLRGSTFLSDYVSANVRFILVAPALALATCLAVSAHSVVHPERRRTGIVTTGAFRYVRHPLYMASILFFLCLAVATASLLSTALCVGIAVFYNHIASYEERVLIAESGEEYTKYRETTGKWLPAIRGHGGSSLDRKGRG